MPEDKSVVERSSAAAHVVVARRCMRLQFFLVTGFWGATMLVFWFAFVSLRRALATPSLRLGHGRQFTIEDDRFVKDGEPFVLRSGSVHYSRVPRAYWRDRLLRVRALGLNAVTTYVPWNLHETEPNAFDFAGAKHVGAFLDEAKDAGLLAILRVGPYMCGEWEFGGFPAWLLRENATLRTYDPAYLAYVDRYWRQLLPQFKNRLYSAGGNVVVIQLENEFGDYGDCSKNENDARYMRHLYDLATQHLGTDVIYSTVSPARNLDKASPWRDDSRVLATVDGGLAGGYAADFALQKAFNAPGHSPKMWTELWTGWYTHWVDATAANKTAAEYGSGVAAMAREPNASFSLYMAHGGTSYGYWSGANDLAPGGPTFAADVTSYDYDAPVGEAGDHTVGADGGDTFAAIRDAIAAVYGAPPDEPPAVPKRAYGAVALAEAAKLLDHVGALATCSEELPSGGAWPSMEDLGQNYGFLLYSQATPSPSPQTLAFDEESLHDRVHVFVDGELSGVPRFRPDCGASCAVDVPGGSDLRLLVENMGRINYGARAAERRDRKGLLKRVGDLDRVTCLPLDPAAVAGLPFRPLDGAATASPVFLRGVLTIDGAPADTYLDTRGLSKGIIWLNGRMLGRFWETAGPQHALYAPAPFLHSGKNDVIVLDLDGKQPPALQSRASQRWAS